MAARAKEDVSTVAAWATSLPTAHLPSSPKEEKGRQQEREEEQKEAKEVSRAKPAAKEAKVLQVVAGIAAATITPLIAHKRAREKEVANLEWWEALRIHARIGIKDGSHHPKISRLVLMNISNGWEV